MLACLIPQQVAVVRTTGKSRGYGQPLKMPELQRVSICWQSARAHLIFGGQGFSETLRTQFFGMGSKPAAAPLSGLQIQ
jgi:hypothetical protein